VNPDDAVGYFIFADLDPDLYPWPADHDPEMDRHQNKKVGSGFGSGSASE
jgi:hypothetical protein